MLVWMDLEMTGLDPGHATSSSRSPRSSPTTSSRSWPRAPTSSSTSPTRRWPAMDPVVVEMHTSSGLLEAIKASTITLEEAGAATLEFIKAHVPEPRTIPLCGNSIGTDRRFLADLPARDRGAPPLPLGRRVHDQGAHPALVPGRARRPRRARPPPTGPSTTSASRSRSCAGTAPTSSSRLDRLTQRSSRFAPVAETTTERPRRQEQEPATTDITEVAPGHPAVAAADHAARASAT